MKIHWRHFEEVEVVVVLIIVGGELRHCVGNVILHQFFVKSVLVGVAFPISLDGG